MKKILIASIVGGLILFAWSAISWMMSPVHFNTFHYTPAQDSILAAMKNAGLETGAYMIPAVDNTNLSAFDPEYKKKCEEVMNKTIGKPAATFFYISSTPPMGISPVLMGLLYSFLAVLCACMLLSLAYQSDASFLMRWWMVMLIAIIYVLTGPMMGHNWMYEPWHYTKGFIIDGLVGWGLTGLWLAKYLKKS